MTTFTNDTALALLRMQAIAAIRADGAKRTEITVADFLAALKKRTPREQGELCRLYIAMVKGERR